MVARKGTGINLGEGAVKVLALPDIDVTPINSYVALVIGRCAPGSKLGFACEVFAAVYLDGGKVSVVLREDILEAVAYYLNIVIAFIEGDVSFGNTVGYEVIASSC